MWNFQIFFNVHALLLNQNNKNTIRFIKISRSPLAGLLSYVCLFLAFLALPLSLLTLSCQFNRHSISPVLLLRTQKTAIPSPAGQQHWAFTNPNGMGVKNKDSTFHPICRYGRMLGPHFVPSAVLPWSITLRKWKLQHGLAGDHVGKPETMGKSRSGWGGLHKMAVSKKPAVRNPVVEHAEQQGRDLTYGGGFMTFCIHPLYLSPSRPSFLHSLYSPWWACSQFLEQARCAGDSEFCAGSSFRADCSSPSPSPELFSEITLLKRRSIQDVNLPPIHPPTYIHSSHPSSWLYVFFLMIII